MIRRFMPLLCIAAAFMTLALVTAPLMPQGGHRFGEDWGYFFSYLLVGEQWVRNNGWLAVPYFTPGFCGGIPWLANPQSMLWSPLQLIFMVLGPYETPWVGLLFYAALGGGGTWLLMRRCFAASHEAASLATVLFVLNDFLAFRIVIGHVAYANFALVPGMAWLVLAGTESTWGIIRRGMMVGVLVAAIAFGGALGVMPPAVLAIAVLVLLDQLRSGLDFRPWAVFFIGCLWSVPLAAIKILPSAALMTQYPRGYLQNALFDDPLHLLRDFIVGFFLPEYLPESLSLGADRAMFRTHEFDFGISAVPLLLLPIGLWVLYVRGRSVLHLWPTILLAVVFAIPIAGTLGTLGWGRVLVHVPIVNNNTVLTRWWLIYMMPLIVATGLSMDVLFEAVRWRAVALAAAAAAAILQFATRDLAFYPGESIGHLIEAPVVVAAHADIVEGRGLPPIGGIGLWPPGLDHGAWSERPLSVIGGISSLPCYEPIFGYGGEMFPGSELHPGTITSGASGFANLADPRCYFGSGDVCAPGARFSVGDPAIAAFVTYRPLTWKMPLWQRAATLSSTISFAISLVLGVGLMIGRASRRLRSASV